MTAVTQPADRLMHEETSDLLGHAAAVFSKEPASRCCSLPVRAAGDLTQHWECSGCGERCDTHRAYRYLLVREWGQGKRLVWVGANPSTAGAFADDNSVRRMVGFSRREGYGAMALVNVCALRATDPAKLAKHPDPVGPHNDQFLYEHAGAGWTVVAAWGVLGGPRARTVTRSLLRRDVNLVCLGTTKGGHPRHPLYLAADTPFEPFGGGS